MGGGCGTYDRQDSCIQDLGGWGRPEVNSPLGRPKCRWENNIKMDVKDMALGVVHWIYLAHDRDRWLTLVNAVMKLRVSKIGEFLD